MALDVTYSAGDQTFRHRFSQADWMAIAALRAHLPDDVAACFDTPDFGRPAEVPTDALRRAATAICDRLAGGGDALPATYEFKFERFPVPGVAAGGFTTGGFGGLRMPGDADHAYAIQAGFDECVLTKMAVGPDGQGIVVSQTDLRGSTEIQTENAGRVSIRRRNRKSGLLSGMREIAGFTARVDAATVTKCVS